MEQSTLTARELLELEPIGVGRFRSRAVQANHTEAIFGGQLIAQALAAAARLAPDKTPISLHGSFLRPGALDRPIDYEVEPLRQGRRVASYRVSARQSGKLIFHLLGSFAEPLDGFEHQRPAPPRLPRPAASPLLAEYVRAQASVLSPRTVGNYAAPFPLELRLIEPQSYFFELLAEPTRAFWMRMPSAATIEQPTLHRCLLAFASDYWLAGVAAGAHVLPTDREALDILSLDHAVWFHRPVRADQWMLYVTDSPSAQEGRGIARGLLYDEAGVLLATTVQEALLLPRTAGRRAGDVGSR